MSQRIVEAALGRLICDDEFRREFFEDAEAALRRQGLQLTAIEIASLRRLRAAAVERMASTVDDRIRRADPEPQRQAEAQLAARRLRQRRSPKSGH